MSRGGIFLSTVLLVGTLAIAHDTAATESPHPQAISENSPQPTTVLPLLGLLGLGSLIAGLIVRR
jgi:hypothetical protein